MKLFLSIIMTFGLTFSCSKKEKVLIAYNISNDKTFGSKEKLVLKPDSTFYYSSTPNNKTIGEAQYFSGKYDIINDTVNLNSSRLKTQIIVIGDQLELLKLHSKMQIEKNYIITNNSYDFKIPQDFSIFTYTKSLEYHFNHTVKNAKASKNDFEKIRKIIQEQIQINSEMFTKNKNQSDYYKQCIFVINEKKEKEVWVQGISKKTLFNENWNKWIIDVKDGGENYFTLKINLTTGKIYYFSPHGLA